MGDLGLLDEKLRNLHLHFLPLEDELLGLLGEVLVAVHLLQLLEFFPGAFKIVIGSLEHHGGFFDHERAVDLEEPLEVFLGLDMGPLGGGQVER